MMHKSSSNASKAYPRRREIATEAGMGRPDPLLPAVSADAAFKGADDI